MFIPTGTGPGPGVLGPKSFQVAHRPLREVTFKNSTKYNGKKLYLLEKKEGGQQEMKAKSNLLDITQGGQALQAETQLAQKY